MSDRKPNALWRLLNSPLVLVLIFSCSLVVFGKAFLSKHRIDVSMEPIEEMDEVDPTRHEDVRHRVKILDVGFRESGFAGRTKIYGLVRNESREILSSLQLAASLRNAEGELLDVKDIHLFDSVIFPGRTVHFSDECDISFRELQAHSNVQAVVELASVEFLKRSPLGIIPHETDDEYQPEVDTNGVEEKYSVRPRIDMSSDTGVYVPRDLDDAYSELINMLHKEFLSEFRNSPEDQVGGTFHFGLGMWLRNNWGLWRGSRLAKWFNAKGIKHPDDMSGILLDSFWRHLNDKPIELDKQIAYYLDYWKRHSSEGPSRGDANVLKEISANKAIDSDKE